MCRDAGQKRREVANLVGCNLSTVVRVLAKHRETGDVHNRKGQGRKKKTSPRQDRQALRAVIANRKMTSPQLATHMAEVGGVTMTPQSWRNRMHEAGFRGRVAGKKPLLSERNLRQRKDFVKEHAGWTEEQWKRVLWSDESTFQLFPNQRETVWRKKHERYLQQCLSPTVKHGGGKVMVWGCISASGVGSLIRVEGNLNHQGYINILQEGMLPSARQLFGRMPYIFQQDNAPCHTARAVQAFFDANGVEVMKWPAQSPDMNPIENLWQVFKSRVHKRKPTNLNQLWEFISQEWRNFTPQEIQKLVGNMPKRVQALQKAKGGATKY